MSPPTPINYIEFSSSDRAASQQFFERAFGWQFVSYGPDYCSFDHAGVDGGIEQSTQAGPPLVVLFTDDLDAAQAAVEASGGTITKAQFDFPGGRRFHFTEPGGTEMAVWGHATG